MQNKVQLFTYSKRFYIVAHYLIVVCKDNH